jgi:APA family basic amino acid/polyamine antiporter
MDVSEYCAMNPKRVFVREATGLVREAGWYDAMSFAGMGVTGPQMVPPWLLLVPFVGADPLSVVIISALGTAAVALMYYLLTISMPRSGGDYVFASRLLHPSLGVLAGIMMGLIYGVTATSWAAGSWISVGLTPLLAYAGVVYNNAGLIDLASKVVTPLYLGVIGTVLILVFTLLLMYGGMRRYFLLQNVGATLAIIGQVIMLAVLLTTSHDRFVQAFNSFAQSYGTGYEQILTQAKQIGWNLPNSSLYNVFLAVPPTFGSIYWVATTTYIGGEIKNPRKSQALGMLGCAFLWSIISFAIFLSVLNMAGYSWVSAYDYVTLNKPELLQLPPVPQLFLYANIAAGQPILAFIMSIGVIAATLPAMGFSLIIFSRALFSMSFDRVLPAALADVSERGTPMKALSIGGIASAVFLILSFLPEAATYITQFGVALGLLAVLTFIIVGLGAMIFPYARKDLYEHVMPFKRKILGIPLITWLGLIVVLFDVQVTYFMLSYSTWYGLTSLFLWIVGGALVFGFLGYYIAKMYRAREGIDLSMVFKQLPPE